MANCVDVKWLSLQLVYAHELNKVVELNHSGIAVCVHRAIHTKRVAVGNEQTGVNVSKIVLLISGQLESLKLGAE